MLRVTYVEDSLKRDKQFHASTYEVHSRENAGGYGLAFYDYDTGQNVHISVEQLVEIKALVGC